MSDSQVLSSATSTAGNGGAASAGNGGAGGAASATAFGTGAVTTNTFNVTANAYGGQGASSGASGHGGPGGSASANAQGTNSGTSLATIQALAVGGGGGLTGGVGFNSGIGGDASAMAFGSSTGMANVTATAIGGTSPGALVDGSTLARAEATGTSGTATASTNSGGSATPLVSTSAVAPVASTSVGESRAAVSEAFPAAILANGLQSAAFSVGMPLASDVTNAVAGNPHATQMVGGGANVLGMMLLGGAYSGSGSGASKTYVSTATFTIDLTQISLFHDLQLASLDGVVTGSGYDELRLEVIREGVTVANELIPNDAQSLSYFNDRIFNFGDIEAGILDNMLDITIRLSLKTDDLNAGFRSLFLLANSPLAVLDADFNNNGIVDAADYVLWRKGYGTTYTISDYNLWRATFGQLVPGSGSGSSNITQANVPEPTAAVLVAIGLAAIAMRRRRRT